MNKRLNLAESARLSLSKPGPWIILAPAILGSLLGFLLSFSFPPKYTSESLISVEPTDSPQGVEQAGRSRDLVQPVPKLQDVLNEERLKPRIDGMALDKSLEKEMADIRRHTRLTRVSMKDNDGGDGRQYSSASQSVDVFHVEYTASTPYEAQLICNAVTSLLLQDNVSVPTPHAGASAEQLQAIKMAKRDLDEHNAKLAQFKKRHVGQLPADIEKNMSVSADLHGQSNILSEKIQLAQHNKAEAESILRQSAVQRKSQKHDLPQTAENAAILEKRLSDLQSQFLQLQAQYTEDHPDVVKTKKEIAGLEKQLADLSKNNESDRSAAQGDSAEQETSQTEQLRARIQQDDQAIDKMMREQKHVQDQISALQAKLVDAPDVESEYEQLLRDRDAAQKKYAIAKTNASAEPTSIIKAPQQPERIRMLSPASVPRSPSFPNRLLFAISGWLGLAVLMRLALWIGPPDSSRILNVLAPSTKALRQNT